MKVKRSQTKHSMKMMWACAALVLLAVIVAVVGNASVLLFVIPCVAMMGMMVWMIMGGMGRMGGGTRGRQQR